MFNRRYAYDKAGNLIQSADQRSGVLNYVYDKIGHIQEARNSQTGRSETFAFDPAHNILSDKVAEGKGKGNNISSGNRLKEYNGIEYTYDALGNLIYRQLPDGENQYYQYDLENQLVCAEIKKPAGNTEIWTYAYDPFGRRLSKERQDKLAWTSTEPKRTHFVWDGSRLLQEYTYKGSYTYIYTDQDSYEPLAQVFDNAKDETQYLAYFHNDQIGIPQEMTDIHGNLLWYGEYTAWGRLKKDGRVYKDAHQPFRLQNQYYDEETGLHYNLFRYYEPEAGRFVNQDPIGLWGGANLYSFAPNVATWTDTLGLKQKCSSCNSAATETSIRVYRKDISLTGEDKYGHWWVELGPNESYGWWASKGVGLSETIFGVPGDLNGQSTFGGTSTMDPHHGDRSKGVNVFKVILPRGKTEEEIKQAIRDYAKNYSGNWSWPAGQDCHSFQESFIKN